MIATYIIISLKLANRGVSRTRTLGKVGPRVIVAATQCRRSVVLGILYLVARFGYSASFITWERLTVTPSP